MASSDNGSYGSSTRPMAWIITPLNFLGVEQICIGVNNMDSDTAGYKQAQYDEVANEMKNMLVKAGWKKALSRRTLQLCRSLVGWATIR